MIRIYLGYRDFEYCEEGIVMIKSGCSKLNFERRNDYQLVIEYFS